MELWLGEVKNLLLACKLHSNQTAFHDWRNQSETWILRGFYNVLIVRVRECAAAAGAGLPDLWRLCFAECGDRTFGRFRRPMAIEGVI